MKQFAMPIAIVLGAALISGTLLYNNKGQVVPSASLTPTPSSQLSVVSDDHILGNIDAKVTIFEFSDFQCPYCRSFFKTVYPEIKKQYIDTGKVKLVYRHTPLIKIHPGAMPAAIASECANEQGKFWDMHDKIFNEQAERNPQELADPSALKTIPFTVEDLNLWASEIGLEMVSYNQCVDSDRYKERIDRDTATAESIGLNGTPLFIINGVRIEGAQPFASSDSRYTPFEPVIEAALK